LLTKSGQQLPVALVTPPIYEDAKLNGGIVVFRELAQMLSEQEQGQLLGAVMSLSNQIFILQNSDG
jgi:hypothetical protein